MRSKFCTCLAAFALLLGITFIANSLGSAGGLSVRAQEDTMKKVTKKVTTTTKTVAGKTKSTSKKVYRKGEVVGGRVWDGGKFVARKTWSGGTWVAVKTTHGTKWVYHRVRGRRHPRP